MANVNNLTQPPQPESVKVNITDTTVIGCKQCGCDQFIPSAKFGKLSTVHPKNPTGQEQFIPFPSYACAKCGSEIDLKEEVKN